MQSYVLCPIVIAHHFGVAGRLWVVIIVDRTPRVKPVAVQVKSLRYVADLFYAVLNKLADHGSLEAQRFRDHAGSTGKSCPIRKLFSEMRRFLVPPSLMRVRETFSCLALSLTRLLSLLASATLLYRNVSSSFHLFLSQQRQIFQQDLYCKPT